MVQKSIEDGVPVAVCFVPEGSSEIRPIAGYAIPQIIERRLDQSLLIFMSGEGRVKLDVSSIQTEKEVSFMNGEVLDESLDLLEELKPQYLALSEVLVRWVTQHIQEKSQRDTFIQSLKTPQEIIGAFAAYLVYDYDLQYEVMELNSLSDQIVFLYRLLESGKLTR